MLILKNWHCLHCKTISTCASSETRIWKFQEVSQSCNMLQLRVKRCSSVSLVRRYVLTIISFKIPHKCDETSLTVTHIAVHLIFE